MCDFSFIYFPIKLQLVYNNKYFRHDSLTIYNGGLKTSPKIGSFCGDTPNTTNKGVGTNPSEFVSTSNQLYFVFKANSYSNDRGFRIRYEKTGKFNIFS